MRMVEFVECSIQVIAQHHRIIARFECRELFFCRKRDKGRGKHAGERGLGCVIGFVNGCVLTMLCDEFCRGVEEVQ
jgi:hypothetical protein